MAGSQLNRQIIIAEARPSTPLLIPLLYLRIFGYSPYEHVFHFHLPYTIIFILWLISSVVEWADNEPDLGNSDCITLGRSTKDSYERRWFDWTCSYVFSSVCSIPYGRPTTLCIKYL